MPPPELEPLVRRLMQDYLDATEGKRLPVGERLEREFAMEHGMLPLGMEYFMQYYLHPEGRFESYSTLFEEIAEEYDDDWSLGYGLRIGSKRHPELASLIAPKPPDGVVCSGCGGSAWMPLENGGNACWECQGHGWNPPALEDLVQRTTEVVRSGVPAEPAFTQWVARFVEEGCAVLGATKPLMMYFDLALQRAGLNHEERDPIIERYLALVPEDD